MTAGTKSHRATLSAAADGRSGALVTRFQIVLSDATETTDASRLTLYLSQNKTKDNAGVTLYLRQKNDKDKQGLTNNTSQLTLYLSQQTTRQTYPILDTEKDQRQTGSYPRPARSKRPRQASPDLSRLTLDLPRRNDQDKSQLAHLDLPYTCAVKTTKTSQPRLVPTYPILVSPHRTSQVKELP